MYRVIKRFKDGQDDMYLYEKGANYPRKGYKPTEERIKGLLGSNNKQGVPLIEEIEEPKEEPKEEKPKKKGK